MIIRKSAQEIDTMARAGKVVAETLALVEEHLQPGITTGELDALADEFIRSHGGVATFLGYKGYPAATCLSPNSMVVHGIPGKTKLEDGDILSVDVGVTLDGFVADSAWTFPVGTISADAQRLLATCKAALEAWIAEEFIRSRGGVPTFKGYKGYPAATCLSPNSMVVHGIPGRTKLENVDILSVDVGVTLDGFVADSAWTFPVGTISADAQRLLDACKAALEAGIDKARVGNTIGDISEAVQTVTEAAGFSVIRSLVGHGVGRSMHEDPQVPNFVSAYKGPELKEGMTIAIEPMITAGAAEVYIHDDEWSISTADASLAAHFEHTVAVTAQGPRILTGKTGVLVP
ncbi:MAG TPA: type I methionyl aminopeptidase [Gaiellaceae bacterium]|nr:type I methionyl aminopeptidase [Gaiellaceae bacterium]